MGHRVQGLGLRASGVRLRAQVRQDISLSAFLCCIRLTIRESVSPSLSVRLFALFSFDEVSADLAVAAEADRVST